MDKKDIENHYQTVKNTIEEAMQKAYEIQVKGDDENAFVKEIQTVISRINDDFKNEIDELQKNSEWEKFCISFFGETNAGKSTLIDALRILYNEESRLNEVVENREATLKILNQYVDVSNALDCELAKIPAEVLIINDNLNFIENEKKRLVTERENLETDKQKTYSEISEKKEEIEKMFQECETIHNSKKGGLFSSKPITFIIGFGLGATLMFAILEIIKIWIK